MLKKKLLCSVIASCLVFSVGCSKKEEVQNTESNKPSANEVVQEQLINEEQSQDPIQYVIKESSAINENLSTFEKKEMTLQPQKEGWEGQTLCLWSNNEKPVKLTATQADDTGKMEGLSSYYFKDGKLIFFKAPFSNHIFEDGKMVLWMDENMNPLDIPKENINDTEKGILDEVSRILDAFHNASDDHIIRFESEEIDFSNVSYQVSESARDENLEKAIVNALNYNKKANGPLRYYYNRIDLNRDQKPETFVYLLGPYVSGSGGSTALIFEGKEDNYKLASRFTLVRNPIMISNDKTNGWNDLIMYVSGGGIEPFYAQIKYDGKKYPTNPSVQPKVKSGTVINGTAIIADDTSKNPGLQLQ